MQSSGQGLWDGANQVDLVRWHKCKDGAGSKDVKRANDRSRNQNRPPDGANGITAFSSEYGYEFEAAQRSEGHFAEEAQAEQSRRRSDQRQGSRGVIISHPV